MLNKKLLLENARVRTQSESSVSSEGGDMNTSAGKGFGYDVDGKFSYTTVKKFLVNVQYYRIDKVSNFNIFEQVTRYQNTGVPKTTVDENGKFSYISSDMRPVPPGWYDLDKSKHRVPVGWYQMGSSPKNL